MPDRLRACRTVQGATVLARGSAGDVFALKRVKVVWELIAMSCECREAGSLDTVIVESTRPDDSGDSPAARAADRCKQTSQTRKKEDKVGLGVMNAQGQRACLLCAFQPLERRRALSVTRPPRLAPFDRHPLCFQRCVGPARSPSDLLGPSPLSIVLGSLPACPPPSASLHVRSPTSSGSTKTESALDPSASAAWTGERSGVWPSSTTTAPLRRSSSL